MGALRRALPNRAHRKPADRLTGLAATGLPLQTALLGPLPLPLPAPARLAAEAVVGTAGLEQFTAAPVGAPGQAVRVDLAVFREVVGLVVDPTIEPADRCVGGTGSGASRRRSVPWWRERLDGDPRVVGEMVGQLVQGAGRGQLLADLGRRRVPRFAAGPTVARQGAIARVEVHDHLAMVLVLAGLERELPRMGCEVCHARIIRPLDEAVSSAAYAAFDAPSGVVDHGPALWKAWRPR